MFVTYIPLGLIYTRLFRGGGSVSVNIWVHFYIYIDTVEYIPLGLIYIHLPPPLRFFVLVACTSASDSVFVFTKGFRVSRFGGICGIQLRVFFVTFVTVKCFIHVFFYHRFNSKFF